MLRKIVGELKKAGYSDSLFFLLKDMCDESKRILNRNELRMEEGLEMTMHISEVRSLLEELSHHEENMAGHERRVRSIQYLIECYLELDELVKNKIGSLTDRG
jgi:hypothetical protein